MSVREAAQAAYEAEEAARKKAAEEKAKNDRIRAKRERQELLARLQHLLDDSNLSTLFPDANWAVVDGGVLERWPRSGEWLIVQEKDDPHGPKFTITAEGTFFEYRGWNGYDHRSFAVHERIKSVLDLGTALRNAEIANHDAAMWFYSGD